MLTPPAQAADPQPYAAKIVGTGQKDLDQALRDSATLISLRQKAQVGPFALVARARDDLGRMTDALRSYGYYASSVEITVDGLPLDDPMLPDKLDAVPSGTQVPVVVVPKLGPQFHVGRIELQGDVPPGTDALLKLHPGEPVLAAQILAAGQQLQTDLQDQGRPLARVAKPVCTLIAAQNALDVSFQVDAGPKADIGGITVSGERALNESYIRRRLALHPGEPFDPRKIEKAREDLAAVPAVASVRITQPDALDAVGQLPLFVQVAERKLHAVDLSAMWSTDEGGNVSVSWTQRNMFGNAEQLVLSAAATQLGGTATKQPGYDVGVLLTFPDWQARGETLALNAQAIKEYLQAYDRTAALASAILSQKLSDELTVSGGLAFEQARITQENVKRTYTLPQLPLTLAYDSTHSLFEPISGFRASLMATPTYSIGSGDAADGTRSRNTAFVIFQVSGSTYMDVGHWLLGEDAGRSILAVRGLLGTITGANVLDVPPDQRFYAGGGGTVRGWRYQSVGPAFPDRVPVGGTSVAVGSVEVRQRILKDYGVVAFVDAGEVDSRGGTFVGGGTVRTRRWPRRALLYPDRTDPPGCRGTAQQGPAHQDGRGRGVYRPRRGVLMPRWAKWLPIGLAVLVGLPVLAVGAVLLLLNTGAGQRMLANRIGGLTGGEVTVAGLHGGLPGAPRIARIEIRDAQGVWLVAEDVALDWSPLALLSADARVQRLSARRIAVERLPVSTSQANTASSSGSTFRLPVRVDADSVHVDRIELAAPVTGTAAALSLDGSAHIASLQQGNADITLHEVDGPGTYHLQGRIDGQTISAVMDANEAAHGTLASLAKLPDLGALSIKGSLDGPRTAVATKLDVTAGPLSAGAHGTLDLQNSAADLALAAHAPKMAPAPGIAFDAVALDAKVHGPFAAPDASGTLRVDGLQAEGAAVEHLTADLSGNRGHIALKATAADLRIPGPRPDLLAASPVTLTADAQLDDPARPITFDLSHPLLHAQGTARTAGTMSVKAHIETPDLGPLAAVAGIDLQGHTALDVEAALPESGEDVSLSGTVGLTGGMAPAPALIGPDAHIDLAASKHGNEIVLSRLRVAGKDLQLSASGALAGGKIDAATDITVADLQAAVPKLQGNAHLHAHITGATDDLAVQSELGGDIGGAGVPKGKLTAKLEAHGLPNTPTGRLEASGRLDGAPLEMAVDMTRAANGETRMTIDHANWKSAHAEGALALASQATLPTGHLALRMTRLEDLRRLTGQNLTGSVTGTVDLADSGGLPTAKAQFRADGAGIPGTATAERLALDARVTNPTGDMNVSATLAADTLAASGITGNVRLQANGPRQALGLTLDATAESLAGGPAQLASRATLDLPASTLAVASLSATAHGETARLLQPAKVIVRDRPLRRPLARRTAPSRAGGGGTAVADAGFDGQPAQCHRRSLPPRRPVAASRRFVVGGGAPDRVSGGAARHRPPGRQRATHARAGRGAAAGADYRAGKTGGQVRPGRRAARRRREPAFRQRHGTARFRRRHGFARRRQCGFGGARPAADRLRPPRPGAPVARRHGDRFAQRPPSQRLGATDGRRGPGFCPRHPHQ